MQQPGDLSIQNLKKGYYFDSTSNCYTCNHCGKQFMIGEIFAINERFFEASKAIELHLIHEHKPQIQVLMDSENKYCTLTENQKQLFLLISQGLTDSEIAKKLGVSASTVRHQRFTFREKAKQAKMFLAIYELSTEKAVSSTKDEIVNIHSGAKMIDERYLTTMNEEEKIISNAFSSLSPLKLKVLSSKQKKKIVILKKIAEQFEAEKHYSEKEVNEILKNIYDDYATVRRYLIEYGFMERTNDCSEYWMNK